MVSLYVRNSQPAGQDVTVDWGDPDAPGFVQVTPKADPSVPAATHTYPRTGTYAIEVVDQSGTRATVATSVQVSGSGPVLTSLNPTSVAANGGRVTVHLVGSAIPTGVLTELDGHHVAGLRISATQVDITGDPAVLGVGKHTVVLKATNGTASAGQTLTVT